MSLLLQRMLRLNGYMDAAGGDDGDSGGSGGGTGGGSGGSGGSNDGGTGGSGGGSGEGGKGPTDAEAKLLKEVMEKKAAIKELNAKLAQVNEQVKKFEGLDPEKIRAMLSEKEALEQKKLEEKGEWEKLKAQMNEANTKVIKEKETTIAELQAELAQSRSTISELTVGSYFSNSKFIQEELALTPTKTRVIYGQYFEFKDGKPVAYDKPAGSKERTVLVDGKGEPLDFDAAIRKLVEADPEADTLLKSKLKTGAGSGTTGRTGKPGKTSEDLHGRDRISAALSSKK